MRSIILLSTGECSLREACCCSCGEDVLWYGGSELTWYHHQHHRLQHWTVALIILSNFHLLSWIRSFFVFSVCLSLLQLNPLLYLQFPCLTCNDIWDAALLLLTLAKKRIRRRKKDKENYLLLSNCYCLLTSTPHPPTCIHMLLLRRERKQKKKKGARLFSFCLFLSVHWSIDNEGTGFDRERQQSTRSHVIEKDDAFFHLHSYPSSISLFHISPFSPSPVTFPNETLEGKTTIWNKCYFFFFLFFFPFHMSSNTTRNRNSKRMSNALRRQNNNDDAIPQSDSRSDPQFICVCVCALDTGDTTGRGRTVDGHVQETKDVSLTWTILYNPPAL